MRRCTPVYTADTTSKHAAMVPIIVSQACTVQAACQTLVVTVCVHRYRVATQAREDSMLPSFSAHNLHRLRHLLLTTLALIRVKNFSGEAALVVLADAGLTATPGCKRCCQQTYGCAFRKLRGMAWPGDVQGCFVYSCRSLHK